MLSGSHFTRRRDEKIDAVTPAWVASIRETVRTPPRETFSTAFYTGGTNVSQCTTALYLRRNFTRIIQSFSVAVVCRSRLEVSFIVLWFFNDD